MNTKMNNNEKIAVIIAAYNIENRIEKCIQSVQKQTYSNWRIYVVDDGSTDKTSFLLDKVASEDTRIQVSHVSNGGKWRAHRIAIDSVKECEYVIFLDSDDELIDKNLFELCIKEFTNDEVDIVSFDYMRNGKVGFGIEERVCLSDNKEKIKNMLNRRIMDGNVCGALYRFSVVKNNYSIMNFNHEDYKNKFDFIRSANKIIILPVLGFLYYKNADSLTQRNITEKDGYYYLHAKVFIEKILLEYPDLGEECNYFVGSILLWTSEKLVQNRKNRKLQIYQPTMKEFRRYVCGHKFKNKYFTLEDRIKICLISLGMYRMVYKIYTKIRDI